ncbi:hypothetical protein LCGC14_2910840 [marine sediment metagenome]|uniref:Uncharacterized protein n=1 Tax=marine sediment metagenome TaxID=412755 RepID=A0A0F9AHT5_9ZZZZ
MDAPRYLNVGAREMVALCQDIAEQWWELRQPSQAQVHSILMMLGYLADHTIELRRNVQEMTRAVNLLSAQLHQASVS